MLADEQIVATVNTLEMAETLRHRLIYREKESRFFIYVFHDSNVPDEYNIGVASEFQGRLSDDVMIELMAEISDFQEEQLAAETDHQGSPPAPVEDLSILEDADSWDGLGQVHKDVV